MSTADDASSAAPTAGTDTASAASSATALPRRSGGRKRLWGKVRARLTLERFDRLWGKARPSLTALWIARASVASVVLGFVLFTVPDAVRDILRALAQDLTPEGRAVSVHLWPLTAFFVGAFLWAVSVHYAARVLLWFDLGMLPDAPAERKKFGRAFTRVPRALGISAIAAVFVGLLLTWWSPGTERLTEETWPLFGLMAVTVAEIGLFVAYTHLRHWTGAFVATSARVVATGFAKGARGAATGVVKGARAVGLVGPADAERAEQPTKSVDGEARAFWLLSWVQSNEPDVQPLFVPSAARNRDRPRAGVPISGGWRPLLYTLMVLQGVGLGALIWAIVEPLSMARFATQSGILFLILSTWIPFFSVLVFIGHWRRFPVVLPLLLLAAIANFFFSYDSHTLRLVSDGTNQESAAKGGQGLPSLDAALDRWGAANPTNNVEGQNSAAPLIILATAGGGSRAAYWTATVLGALQDADPDFRSGLFAISAVSGGALGAGVFDALLLHADRPSHDASKRPFCRDGDEKDVERDHPHRFAQCGQAVAAGDFLAPPIAVLGYQDAIRWLLPLPLLGTDRATAIEWSWEAAWRQSAEPDLGDDKGIFAEPFISLAPNARGPWRPLLFFNGTSVGTGKRIVASPLPLLGAGRAPLLLDAYDVFDLLPAAAPGGLRLSTAISIAARFPYVLPAGSLRGGKECEARVCDRVVDGGYFENFGAATAEELLSRIREGARASGPMGSGAVWHRADGTAFRPVVVQISSDPGLDPERASPGIAKKVQSRMWAEIGAPPSALYGTESARGLLAMQSLKRRAEQEYGIPFVHLALRGDHPAIIPLSWSLSRAAQRNIEKRLCDRYNYGQLARLAAAIGRDDLTASVCGKEAP